MFSGWLGYSIRRGLLDADLEAVSPHIRGNVLEVGCGALGRRGHYVPPTDNVNRWIYADMRSEVIPTVVADVQQLPFQNQCFDVVLCLEVLEYVPSPAAALDELNRVLKPDGTLILSTPFLHRSDTDNDNWRFTQNGLQRLLKGAGFQIEDMKQQGAALATAVNILKFSVYSMSSNSGRKLVGAVSYFPLMSLFKMDVYVAKRLPILKNFSTGFLAVAGKV